MNRYFPAKSRFLPAVPAALLNAALIIMLSGAWNWASAGTVAGQDQARTRNVSFEDLDLAGRSGVATLYARIKVAAQDVCEPVNARALSSAQLARHCTEQAIAEAVATVNSPALSNYDRAKSARTRVVTLASEHRARE
ncbi:MAG TPA: UrcA family protein [Steroidobacteraceae bacterium]|jgi:UrcA family protein|nr:UrcA family protein [Steroidobacteraceae bacterium]